MLFEFITLTAPEKWEPLPKCLTPPLLLSQGIPTFGKTPSPRGAGKESSVRAEQTPSHTQPASRHALSVAAAEGDRRQEDISCPAAHPVSQLLRADPCRKREPPELRF